MLLRTIACLSLLVIACTAAAQGVPPQIERQLPTGYRMLHSEHAAFERHDFYIVALVRTEERRDPAPDRPVLIFARRPGGDFALAARNDHVALRADEGGQCDPFEDGGITAKGRTFTVAHVVACGQHWSQLVTFRFDPAAKTYVFDNSRFESWHPNPKDDPEGEALISGGVQVNRAPKGRRIRFADWRP